MFGGEHGEEKEGRLLMGGGGGIVGTIARAVTAAATGGTSELARKKPFQPGGSNNIKGLAIQSAFGLAGGTVAALKHALTQSPPPIDTSAADAAGVVAKQAQAAADAVQTADAEGRRARSAKRRSSVLGSYQAGQQTNAATLQPAQPRKSVLG
jgi:hypothetical protein